MGSMEPITAAMTVANMGMDLMKGERGAGLQRAAAAADLQARSQQIQRQLQYQEDQRRQDLNRTQAAQRARFGAMGIGGGGGSSEALLDGLTTAFEKANAADRGMAQMQLDQLSQQAAYKERMNLLNASQNRFQWLLGAARRFLPSQNTLKSRSGTSDYGY